MTKNELLLVSKLLKMASEEFSNHGCNDVSDEMYAGWTKEERQNLVKDFHEMNGDPEEYSPEYLHLGDDTLMSIFAKKLEVEAKK
jgi:hypothetical protein